jgi:hypothetical protein
MSGAVGYIRFLKNNFELCIHCLTEFIQPYILCIHLENTLTLSDPYNM